MLIFQCYGKHDVLSSSSSPHLAWLHVNSNSRPLLDTYSHWNKPQTIKAIIHCLYQVPRYQDWRSSFNRQHTLYLRNGETRGFLSLLLALQLATTLSHSRLPLSPLAQSCTSEPIGVESYVVGLSCMTTEPRYHPPSNAPSWIEQFCATSVRGLITGDWLVPHTLTNPSPTQRISKCGACQNQCWGWMIANNGLWVALQINIGAHFTRLMSKSGWTNQDIGAVMVQIDGVLLPPLCP